MTNAPWRKSSHSDNQGGNCVELRSHSAAAVVELRDSKAPQFGTLAVPRNEFTGLLRQLGNRPRV